MKQQHQRTYPIDNAAQKNPWIIFTHFKVKSNGSAKHINRLLLFLLLRSFTKAENNYTSNELVQTHSFVVSRQMQSSILRQRKWLNFSFKDSNISQINVILNFTIRYRQTIRILGTHLANELILRSSC